MRGRWNIPPPSCCTGHGEGTALSNQIALEPIDESNFEAVVALDVQDDQRHLVASNTRSIAQAYIYKHAEPYALKSGDTIVGFTMLYPLTSHGEPAVVNLVRIMIHSTYQRQGLGRTALESIIENIRRRPGARAVQLSVLPENLGAIRLYEAAGFTDTGQVVEGEQVYRLRLDKT